MPIFTAKSSADVLKTLNDCKTVADEFDKASFAGMGMKMKKQLGPSIWSDEVQELFKSILQMLR